METKKLKMFEMAKKSLALIDLDANKHQFHRMQIIHVIQGCLALVLLSLYLVYDANTTLEYMSSIYMTTVGI